jgi:hypothetical protein
VRLGLLFVFFVAAQVEEAAMNFRMQGFHTSIKDFRKAREF